VVGHLIFGKMLGLLAAHRPPRIAAPTSVLERRPAIG
jgi:hypothetical protein